MFRVMLNDDLLIWHSLIIISLQYSLIRICVRMTGMHVHC